MVMIQDIFVATTIPFPFMHKDQATYRIFVMLKVRK